MKIFRLIALSLLLMLSYSCSKREIGVFPRYYLLQLNFLDSFGIEILKDIPIVKLGGYLVLEDIDGWSGEVKSEIFNLDIILPELCFKLQEPRSERTGYPLFVNKIANRYYLHMKADGSSLCPPAGIITHKLTCPHIFGDNAEHIIISYWKPREDSHSSWILKDGTSALNYCYRIEIDGQDFPVTQEIFVSNHSEESKKIFLQHNGKEQISKTLSVGWIVLDN